MTKISTIIVVAAFAFAGTASAQTTSSTAPPASTSSGTTDAPKPGANSFTEEQARSRIEGTGVSGVAGLTKDTNGIWMGTAMQGGKSVKDELDYQGNVVVK